MKRLDSRRKKPDGSRGGFEANRELFFLSTFENPRVPVRRQERSPGATSSLSGNTLEKFDVIAEAAALVTIDPIYLTATREATSRVNRFLPSASSFLRRVPRKYRRRAADAYALQRDDKKVTQRASVLIHCDCLARFSYPVLCKECSLEQQLVTRSSNSQEHSNFLLYSTECFHTKCFFIHNALPSMRFQ